MSLHEHRVPIVRAGLRPARWGPVAVQNTSQLHGLGRRQRGFREVKIIGEVSRKLTRRFDSIEFHKLPISIVAQYFAQTTWAISKLVDIADWECKLL